ncbi:MAG: Secretion system C-terminal sorting domain, partial [Bacteroidota bacterium]
ITKLVNSNEINIYPNPASNFITLKYNISKNAKASLKLFDIYGRCIKIISLSSDIQILTTDVSEIISGMYFYKYIVDEKELQIGKIIVN